MRTRHWLAALALPLLAVSLLPAPAPASALAPVQVILDGQVLALNPAPTIISDRTLVPLRGVFEAMGATPVWNGENRTVEVTRGTSYVRLKIDKRLACLNTDCTNATMLDVPATIVEDRTFVPVRFIAQAMGAKVSWDNTRRAVVIETDKPPVSDANPITIPTLLSGMSVEGPVKLRAAGATGAGVQFYLLDPATGKGPMIASGADPAAEYLYTPDPSVSGTRLVVAGVRDEAGNWRYSDPVTVHMAPKPRVSVTGIDWEGLVDGPISFGSDVNFAAAKVSFKIISGEDSFTPLGPVGAGDRVTWYPQVTDNGRRWIQAVAYDRAGTAYPSLAVPVQVQSGYRTVFTGVKEGDVLTGPVTLRTAGNYPIEYVKYTLDGQILGWGTAPFTWAIDPTTNGEHTLQVDVQEQGGQLRTIGPVHFTVNAQPRITLSGVGPDQVVTGPITLRINSNVPLKDVTLYANDATGRPTPIAHPAAGEDFTWTPTVAGSQTIYASAVDTQGRSLYTPKVNFRVFLGKIYKPQPLVPKSEYLALASRLAVANSRETGIAASLQVAQAILETGWGQSVPVDKYTGQLSYNLFGIKGTGPAGSIISNTWEEYNGLTHWVDANFRAYHNVEESWQDHGNFLLLRPWYAPFRAVMADPVLGAWGLKKSGYATDSQYPIKLINIMNTYGLFKLDDVEL